MVQGWSNVSPSAACYKVSIKHCKTVVCVKPGWELFCAGFGISTPGREEGWHRASEWRVCILIPRLSVCSRVKNLVGRPPASGRLGGVPRPCVSVRGACGKVQESCKSKSRIPDILLSRDDAQMRVQCKASF